MVQTGEQNRYQELDSLRGLAALMVVGFHFSLGRDEAGRLFNVGSTGVDLFFIISGFVIFMSLANSKRGRDFVISRVSRLYPTYWTCVTLTFILIKLSSPNDALYSNATGVDYLANMTMFQHFFKIKDLDGPYWTMIIEMMFYIGMLLLFQVKWLRHIDKIGLTLIPFTLIAYSFKENYFIDKFLDGFSIFRYVPLFFAGIIFYKIHTTQKNLAYYYGILLICLVSQISLFNYLDRSWLINQYAYIIALVSYFTLFTLFVNGKLRFVISGPALFLGKISYPLYLVHQFLAVHLLIPFFTDKLGINFWVASWLITLPILIALAWLISQFIEKPMGKLMKQKLRAQFVKQHVQVPVKEM